MIAGGDSLALVVPVRDDRAGLSHLLQQAANTGIFDQIVISDDGSHAPVRAEDCGIGADRITILRSDVPGGAGAARNRALPEVRTSHLLFFDSDDSLTSEMAPLWHDLAGKDFDFCLFRHHDSRTGRYGGWGQLPLDNAFWREAGAGGAALFEPDEAGLSALAETANYPWNKVYSTEFLRRYGLRFSHTPVHNDILFHWLSFLRAGRILASDRVAALHEVHQVGHRLTNRTGADRLCVFEPLDEVATALAGAGRPGLRAAFFHFAAMLLDWVRTALAEEHHPALDSGTGQFLRRHLDPDLFSRLGRSDPVLALRLVLQMAGGQARC